MLLRQIFAVLMLALAWHAVPAMAKLPEPRAGMDRIHAELVVERAVRPGESVELAFKMTPVPGWHGYWKNPGDAGQGATFTWELPPGWQVGMPRYPTPETYVLAGLVSHAYEHEYAILVPLKVPADARPGTTLPVRVHAEWLACSDTLCVPQDAVLGAEVTVGEGTADPRFDRWRAALPAPLGSPTRFAADSKQIRIAIPLPIAVKLKQPHFFADEDNVIDYAAAQSFARKGDLLVVTLARAKAEPVAPSTLFGVLRLNQAGDGVEIAATPGAVPTDATPIETGAVPALPALPMLLLGALAGGLLLNIMPCVFPILSLKALSLARAGENEAQARAEGLAYSAGVVLACLALGALMLALRAAGQEVGWAFQLQEPLVVAGLLLLAVAITANLLGLFELTVPGFASADTPHGAFATGLLAAFVATPCTGPFMAAAMGAALLLPVGPALALFAMLGLGLALPFLALAFIPALRRRLPKPGAWMNRFKLAMAVPMALTALALLWLTSRLGGNGFALAAGLLTIILIAVLLVLGRRQRSGLAGGMPVWGALGMLSAAFAIGMPGMVRAPLAAEAAKLGARPFSEAELAQARSLGKPVFVYFTADWCLTCKVNEKVALENEDTRHNFARAGVVVLRGDWTRRDPAITRFLTDHGAAGVPLYLWYPPRGSEQQLPQVLTPRLLGDLVRQTRSD